MRGSVWMIELLWVVVVTIGLCASGAASQNITNSSFTCVGDSFLVDVEWTINDDVICFTASTECEGGCWLGIGFNSPSDPIAHVMRYADYYIATFDNKSQSFTVTDMHMEETSPPFDDTLFGCRNNIILPPYSASQVDGVTTYSFCRLLDTGDDLCDKKIVLDEDIIVMCAHGTSNDFAYHGTLFRSYFTYKFSAKDPDTHNNIISDDSGSYIQWHAGLMFLAFGILMPLGAFIARYLRAYWWWFPMHMGIQFVAIAITIISFIIIIDMTDDDVSFTFIHAYVGLAALILAWLAPLIGLCAHIMWDPDRSHAPVFPDKVHWYNGLLAILVGFAAIYLGCFRMGVIPLAYVFVVLVVIYVLVFMSIELARTQKSDEEYNPLN